MEKYELGINKKSFSLYFGGGEIWCEHLDSLCDRKDLFFEKFDNDLKTIKRPSASSYLAVILNETDVDREMIDYLLDTFISLDKPLKKIAFIGLDNKWNKYINKKNKGTYILMKSISDLEEAKNWLIDNR
ncbi:MAG: hypothetical protein U0L17_04090 [Acutalibacteraceae bacterium]|nr:hypothetical protein [Acutalibacteraceae bacterium]